MCATGWWLTGEVVVSDRGRCAVLPPGEWARYVVVGICPVMVKCMMGRGLGPVVLSILPGGS